MPAEGEKKGNKRKGKGRERRSGGEDKAAFPAKSPAMARLSFFSKVSHGEDFSLSD